jgi:methylglutaconyl-CoA hydratase
MAGAPLRVDRSGPVLRVTLSRPERRNALDAGLIADLAAAFADVGDARVVVLAGEGEAFCAGADVDWMRSSAHLGPDENLQEANRLRAMLEAIDRCPAPVVARVQRYALGGGAGIVCCSDVAVCDEGASFGFTEVKLGLIPSVISPFVLRRIGPGASRRYFLTGERFRPETALRIGVVHEVVPADALDGAVDRIVGEILSAAPEAVRHAKRLVLDAPLDGEETARRIAERRASAEGQEGLGAFLAGRVPGRPGFASWTDDA